MTSDALAKRQQWFRHFPEGTLEFAVVTRVLGLMMAAALLVVPTADQKWVLLGLIAILWTDYALVLWWAMQIQRDVNCLSQPEGNDAISSGQAHILAGALLPSLALTLLGALRVSENPGAQRGLTPVIALLLVYLALLWPALRILRKCGLGGVLTRLLLLVPVLHWFAVHRHIRRLAAQMTRRPEPTEKSSGGTAVIIADATLILTLAPAVAFVVLRWQQFSGGALALLLGAVEFLALGMCTLFAISDLAAMEGLQRAFVASLRRR